MSYKKLIFKLNILNINYLYFSKIHINKMHKQSQSSVVSYRSALLSNLSDDNAGISEKQFDKLTNVYLSDKIKSLTDRQKFIPSDGTKFPMPHPDYSYQKKLKNFIEKNKINSQLCIGFSSGGALKHTIFCDENRQFYVISQTFDNEIRIYYLTTWILKDLFMNTDKELTNIFLSNNKKNKIEKKYEDLWDNEYSKVMDLVRSEDMTVMDLIYNDIYQ